MGLPRVEWVEDGVSRGAGWRSESQQAPPRRLQVADDRMPADTAYRLVCEGTALLWRGDYHNARQLLQAMARRIDRKPRRQGNPSVDPGAAAAFNRHRLAQAQRARVLGAVLLEVDGDHHLPLRRAPDVRAACTAAYGVSPSGASSYLVSLRELLGVIGAHEWRRRGVPIPALNAAIHPHYGVFSPLRGEYVDLVAQAPLPVGGTAGAADIGTGTGVLAAVLARRGASRIVATDQDPRALACARENLDRLGLANAVTVMAADLFPPGCFDLLVCNPPWLPARPSSPLEHAVYDPDSRMLRGFLAGLVDHLAPGGEGWLILSDLAEHLGLRPRETLLGWFGTAGLTLLERIDIRPRHGKATDAKDPLHAARAAEVTSLWRLARRAPDAASTSA